ncbi:MAG: magnesium transporter [Oscillospiraceae bacterium]|nr:magnesium transporter [Oscillospiraceae bacterium]
MDQKNFPEELNLELQHPDYKAEILEIVRSRLTPKRKAEKLTDYHENDIAAAMEELSREERVRLYSVLDMDTLALIFEYFDEITDYIGELSIRKRADLLSLLETVTAAEYLRELDGDEQKKLVSLMEAESREELDLVFSFDEDEVGSRITTNFITIPEGCTVRQAMRELVKQAEEHDNLSTLYVVDEDETLLGAIELTDLIRAREGDDLETITMTSYPYVYASEKLDDCIERMKDYSEDSIPVLDEDNRLIGVVTAQDLTELVDEALVEDYAKLAGLTAEEDLDEPLTKSIGKRLPWLAILLVLGLVVSSVVGLFEGIAAEIPVVVCFQSLILAMAGNVGTQSLAIAIRVLMDEQITGKQKLFLIGKEARVGLCNGFIISVLSFLLVGGYLTLAKGIAVPMAFSVALCTGVALLAAMLISSLMGTIIPILFKKLNIDPAVASGPLITTINDLVAVVIYYGLVWLFLIQWLGL